MENKTFTIGQCEIVALKFNDSELSDFRDTSYHESYPNGLLRTYLLVNPDKHKLEELKDKVENRRDFEDEYDNLTDEQIKAAEDFCDSIWDFIDEFVNQHFTVLSVNDDFNITY